MMTRAMLVVVWLMLTVTPARAQLDSAVRDAAVPASVQVGVVVQDAAGDLTVISVGSGTVVSADGLVLTNQHVVDTAGIEQTLEEKRVRATAAGQNWDFQLRPGDFAIAISDGRRPPELRFLATVAAENADLDLAVLQVDRDRYSRPVNPDELNLPHAQLGSTESIRLGDPLHIFGFPVIGQGSLTYTEGVVSGFLYEAGIDGPAWINTDAVISGGSSGSGAFDDAGLLIGVATSGAPLDCRPGDVNGDGVVDDADVGCVPTGGSLGQIRPIDLALPLLQQVDPTLTGAGDANAQTSPYEQTEAASLDSAAADGFDALVRTATSCAGRADWRCATRYFADALARRDDPEIRSALADAYLGLGELEEDDGQVGAARDAFRQALALDPARSEAVAGLDRLAPYARALMSDGFGGDHRYAPSSSPDSAATYDDDRFTMTVSSPGLISGYPLMRENLPSGNYAVALDIASTEGSGAVTIEIDADEPWIFTVDPFNQQWGLLQRDAESGRFTPWLEPSDASAALADGLSRLEVRVVGGAPALLIDGVDVAGAAGIALPPLGAPTALDFGASMNPEGEAPFTVSFDRVAVYELA
ncbi:MAG: trypsin-like peptidase domain-containing protein [Thermomicrobiales bacterium]|nr:trypsin-like peptidase domain-containing protein [Thermomicrobiales bacterium]